MQTVGWQALGTRPMVVVGLSCVGGVALGPETGISAPQFFLAAATLAGLAWWQSHRTGAYLMALFSIGLLGSAIATQHASPDREPVSRARVILNATVESVRTFPEGSSLTVLVGAIDGAPTRFRAILFSSTVVNVLEGQQILVPTKLRTLSPAMNPGEPDRFTYQLRRAAIVHGSFDAEALVILEDTSRSTHWLNQTHHEMTLAANALSKNAEAVALFLTLSAGERALLGDEWEAAFARSGLAHVLSVSGLHVAVLALALFQFMRWLLTRRQTQFFRRFEAQRVAAVAALPWVWAYVWFTGTQAPAVRSAVMISLMLLGLAVRRRTEALTALAIAAAVMTCAQPWTLFDLSVQLSFLSVLSLVLLTGRIRNAIPIDPPSPGTTKGWRLRLQEFREATIHTFAASAAVTVASAPLLAMVFQRFSLAGLISNIVMLPVCAVLTLVSAASSAVFSLSPMLAKPVMMCGIWLSQLVVGAASFFSSLPGASVSVSTPSIALCLLWWAGLLVVALTASHWRWLGLAGPVAAACMLMISLPKSDEPLSVTFLSVGHGDAIIVSAHGHHAIIDGGGIPNGADVGQRIVLPFLKTRGISEFEFALLTHPHPDHALGLISTLRQVPTKQLWLSDDFEGGALVDELIDAVGPAQLKAVSTTTPVVKLGDALVEVLGPPPGEGQTLLEGENDRSVVLRISLGKTSFLLTGDVEMAAEALLHVEHREGETLIVKVPHHGSATSSAPAFVSSLHADIAVVSVGRDNRFHLPKSEVLARYESAGTKVMRTDESGAITIQTDGAHVTVSQFLPEGSRVALANQ